MSSDDTSELVAAEDTAQPSGRGLFASLGDVVNRTSDGAYQARTVHAAGVPLATLVPYQEPVVVEPVPSSVMVRLSRFAYLHRVGREFRLQTPLAVEYLELNDPRAGAMISAMDFDRTPGDLADIVGLPVTSVCELLGAMRAMKAVETVVESRDPSEPIAAALRWAANGGVPGAWWNDRVKAALTRIPWSALDDNFEIMWELHHPSSSGQVDISISILDESALPRARKVFCEYDISPDGSALMGEFFAIDEANLTALVLALRDRGVNVPWTETGAVAALVADVGWPTWVGVLQRRDGVRLVIPVASGVQWSAAASILKQFGVDESIVDRLPLLDPLIGGDLDARLTIDAVGDGLGPRVGLEVADRGAIRVIPGVLDALGVSSHIIEEVTSVVAEPLREIRMESVPGVVTDAQSRLVSHVKVGFEANGEVAVKTYLSMQNMPLAVDGRSVEDVDVPPTWEFHDLLFHALTRNGRVRERLGGTARFSVVPEMAHFDTEPGPSDFLLPTVDVATVAANDRPFGEVLRSRESDRDWSGPEIPLSRLSELLARVMEVIPREMDLGGLSTEFDGQPYPSGGGIYEVDVVVVAYRVSGLEPGPYLYRRGAHSLSPLFGDVADVDGLLFGAAEATGNGMTRPQALLVLAARFPDLAVKYQGIAYSLMLKHVGVLQATIAYTAVAMGLGAVPLGTGDSDAFARATGLDYYTHGSIGEIALSIR